MAKNRPSPSLIRMVVTHLEEMGLSVYGSYTDLETGAQYSGCMDLGIDEILAYRKLHIHNKLHKSKELTDG